MRRRSTGGKISVLIALICTFVLSACNEREAPPTLDLAETPVLSGHARYALVTIEYVRLYERPDSDATILFHARCGDVLTVIGSTPDRLWFETEAQGRSGWIDRESLRLFSTQEQARNARETLDVR